MFSLTNIVDAIEDYAIDNKCGPPLVQLARVHPKKRGEKKRLPNKCQGRVKSLTELHSSRSISSQLEGRLQAASNEKVTVER